MNLIVSKNPPERKEPTTLLNDDVSKVPDVKNLTTKKRVSRKDKKKRRLRKRKAILPTPVSMTSVNTEELLRQYETKMKASGAKKEVLTWHLIILDNFIRNFLAEHGMAIIRLPQSNL